MQKVEVTTPATFPLVTAADMRAYLRLNDSGEDTLLSQFVDAARDLFEVHTGLVLAASTLRLRLDHWPTAGYRDSASVYPGDFATASCIYIPRGPVNSITSVQYLDTDGSWQTLTGTSSYIVTQPARVILPTALPGTHPSQRPAVRVTFTAGFANAAAVPSAILVAIKLLAAHFYENRTAYGDDMTELPQGWFALTKRFSLECSGNWNR